MSTTVGRMACQVAASNLDVVVFGGLAFTYKRKSLELFDLASLTILMFFALVQLFLYAWPADYLTESLAPVSVSKRRWYTGPGPVLVFLLVWYRRYRTELDQRRQKMPEYIQVGKSPAMHQSSLFIMQKATQPLAVKLDGLLPVLNLEMFGTAMSTSFSYIATLLTIFGD